VNSTMPKHQRDLGLEPVFGNHLADRRRSSGC
jgi:hypothetical protein